MFRHVGIVGTGYYVPERVLTNHDLERIVDTSDEWIYAKTGIKERRLAADHQATSDLAIQASLSALDDAGLTPEDLDLIIVATSTPDTIQPSTAAIVQGKIGARHAAAFDISAVCSGFVYAINVAIGMMKAFPNYRRSLVIGAETYSRILDWKDRTTCVYFGDGAGAVVLGDVTKGYGHLSSYLMTDGTGWDVILFPAGGSRQPTTHQTIDDGLHAFRMQGKKVWDFAIRAFPEAIREVTQRAGVSVADIDLIISHQANVNIIKKSLEVLGLPLEKTYTNLDKYGNTSGASIPIALAEADRIGLLDNGSLLALVGFGGGLCWGSSLFRWSKSITISKRDMIAAGRSM